jgi:hypothetical protein
VTNANDYKLFIKRQGRTTMKQPTPKDIWITKNLPHFGNKQQNLLYREHVLKLTSNLIKERTNEIKN